MKFVKLLWLSLIFSTPVLANEPGYSQTSGNYCTGGVEDRKLIVPEELVSNIFKQTTAFSCVLSGGRADTMPDLPDYSKPAEILV